MSKKFLKQLGNVVVLQVAGYAVSEVIKTVGPKVKKAMGMKDTTDDVASEAACKEKQEEAEKARNGNQEISNLIQETRASVAKKKRPPVVDVKENEEE